MDSTATVFLRFVEPHWEGLYLVARRYAGHGDDARDLVQETLMRAWRGFSPDRDRTYRRAWLFVIMRNVVLDWHRASRRRINLVPVPVSELTDAAVYDPTESFHALPAMDEQQFREFLDDKIVAALDRLDDSFREVLILSVAGDLSYREIADVLDCPIGTVMSRVARARRILREQLSDFARSRNWITERQR